MELKHILGGGTRLELVTSRRELPQLLDFAYFLLAHEASHHAPRPLGAEPNHLCLAAAHFLEDALDETSLQRLPPNRLDVLLACQVHHHATALRQGLIDALANAITPVSIQIFAQRRLEPGAHLQTIRLNQIQG